MKVRYQKTGQKGYAQHSRIQFQNKERTQAAVSNCTCINKAHNRWVLLQVNWMFQQPATLELTHNWGTESDADANMHNGNDKPQGYGHIGSACIRFLTWLGAPCTVQVLSIS